MKMEGGLKDNLLAGVAVAIGLVAAASFFRYEIAVGAEPKFLVYRLDRLTGRVELCIAVGQVIEEAQPRWCKAIKGENSN